MRLRNITVVLLAVSAVHIVRADLSTPRVARTVSQSPARNAAMSSSSLLAGRVNLNLDCSLPTNALPLSVADVDAARSSISSPPAPNSAAVVMWAIASLGAWHVARNSRKFSLNLAPDWYHTGGPSQVGYAVPLEVDRNAMPICTLDRPLVQAYPIHLNQVLDVTPPHSPQWRPAPAGPRAPPA